MKKYCLITISLVLVVCIQASFTDGINNGKAALGKRLFFDPILSKDKTVSCASCHKPRFAFADTSIVSLGVKQKKGTRNTPTVMNTAGQPFFFWDGRSGTMEEQALQPIENPLEMNLPIAQALLRLANNETYRLAFKKAFNSIPTRENLGAAIAAYEQTLETSSSPFDRWKMLDDTNAVSASVKRGFSIFNTKGKCTQCHFGSNFTQHQFRNIGLFNGRDLNDSGRITISGKPEDLGRFKVPGLRNIALTAPYMHNGKLKTLAEVIDFYNEPDKQVPNAINRDTVLQRPLGLTQPERKDLEAFLHSLTDVQFIPTKKPIPER